MDDTAQVNQPAEDVQQVPPVQPASATQSQPISQPVAPVGVAHKEHAPVSSPVVEHIRPAPHEAMPAIPKEAASHIEVSPNVEQPKLTEEHRKLGISEAKESLPAPAALSDDNSFPLTPTQVTQSQTKQYTVWDSFKWYGKTVGRQMLRKLFLQKDK